MPEDKRYVYGFCTWHDSVQNAGRTNPSRVTRSDGSVSDPISLPCCPHCGSMLMETPSEEEWWEGVALYDRTHPGYEAKTRWSRGKCFRNMVELDAAYAEHLEGSNGNTGV